MKCPRCSTSILAQPDAQGLLTCPGCGSRLRTRAAAPAAPPAPPAAAPRATPPPPPPAAAPRPAPVTLRPQPSPLAAPPPAPSPAAPPAPMTPAALLEAILTEVRAVRASQHEMMRLLKSGAAAAQAGAETPYVELGVDDMENGGPAPTRSRRRKSVLLIDDDPETLQAAVAALDRVEVPVRSTSDGNEALGLIAREKPDVILLELELQGEMAGRDVVNMIKATMEWVDIPLVLYTRAALQSQKEARQIHGADDYVLKGPGGAETVVQKVIAIFRKA